MTRQEFTPPPELLINISIKPQLNTFIAKCNELAEIGSELEVDLDRLVDLLFKLVHLSLNAAEVVTSKGDLLPTTAIDRGGET